MSKIGIGIGLTQNPYGRPPPDFAQIEPGGNWLRPDYGLLDGSGNPIADGVAAASWAVRLGTSPLHAQATGANRPTWTASDSTGNGKPSLTFDSTDYFEQSTSNVITAAGTSWVFFVGKASSTAGGPILTSRRSAPYLATCFMGTNCYIAGDGSRASMNMTIADFTKSNLFWAVTQWRGTGQHPQVWINGVLQTITSGAPPATQQETESGSTGSMIGANSAGQRWYGRMFDLGFKNASTISTAQLAALGNYVRYRYGI